MKLSLLTSILCLGLLGWNAWLQVQVDRLSRQSPTSSELRLTKLEIVDAQGSSVITASADDKGAAMLNVKGLVGATAVLIGSEKGKVAVLTENSLDFEAAKGDKKAMSIAMIENDDGIGKLHLVNSDQPGTSFNAFPTGLIASDSKLKTAMTLDVSGLGLDTVKGEGNDVQFNPIAVLENNKGTGKLHFYDDLEIGTSLDAHARGVSSSNAKTGTAFILDGIGMEFDSITGSDKKYERIAALENHEGEGRLHLYDTGNPNLSLHAWTTGIRSMDSTTNHANWQIPSLDGSDAYLDVTNKEFGTAKSSLGTFLISCQGVEPYLEGYKVHLQIGNPMAMLVSNPKLTIEWGAQLPKPDPDSKADSSTFQAWKKSLQQTSITLNSNLRPGCWNDVEVVVSPAKANELAHFKSRSKPIRSV